MRAAGSDTVAAVFEEGRVTPFGPHESSRLRTHAPSRTNVLAVASRPSQHLDEHVDRGHRLRPHINACTPTGALPQTPGRAAASLRASPARSAAACMSLLAVAPR